MRKLRAKSAVLIMNPNSGRLARAFRLDVVEALRERLGIETFAATERDAAISLAREAAEAGTEVVIAFGGDGHVNEVANGVAGTEARLGIVPGGTMNVFSRALGIPQDPLGAVEHLVEAIERPARLVPLGRMDDRYFTFSAGCGFDAEVAERVERYFDYKRRFGELFFYWSALRVLTGSMNLRSPCMTLSGDFGDVPVAMAIACNTGPYAYIGGRGVHLTPEVQLDAGLDIFSLERMKIENLPLYFWCVAVAGNLVHQPDVFYRSDMQSFEIHADRPFHRHVDGEPLPTSTSASFCIEKDALSVAV